MDRRFLVVTGILLVAGAVIDGYTVRKREAAAQELSVQVELAKGDAQRYREDAVGAHCE